MATSNETLAAIVEAGKRATDRPWTSVEMWSRPDRAYLASKLVPIFASGSSMSQGGHAKVADADYMELAANHADHLAAELMRLRAERDRFVEVVEGIETLIEETDDCEVARNKVQSRLERFRAANNGEQAY